MCVNNHSYGETSTQTPMGLAGQPGCTVSLLDLVFKKIRWQETKEDTYHCLVAYTGTGTQICRNSHTQTLSCDTLIRENNLSIYPQARQARLPTANPVDPINLLH